MGMTDTRLTYDEKSLLAHMVGKTLDELVHDKYIGPHTSYMSVWIVVDGDVFDVHCEVEPRSHFGEVDDVAVVSVRPSGREAMQSHLAGHPLSTERISRIICDIKVVEDTQEMLNGDEVEHAFAFTSAIIFELDGSEVMLAFGPWFSEDIGIERGPHASSKLPAAIDDISEEDRQWYRVNRQASSIRERGEEHGG